MFVVILMKKESSEGNSHKKKNEKPFLGLQGAVWISSDLYIKFPNSTHSSTDIPISRFEEPKGTRIIQ